MTRAAVLALAVGAAAPPSQATVLQFGADGAVTVIDRAAERPPPPATRQDRAVWRAMAEEIALRHAGADAVAAAGLDALGFVALFTALIDQESRFDPRAVSPKGAQGLGQLMPGTAAALGVSDAFDPAANLDGAARYLVEQLGRFGDVRLALAAYNAGPHRVVQFGGVPPYAETRDYVAAITAAAGLAPSADRAVATPVSAPSVPAERSLSVWQY